jgi:type II secretory pathway component PulF
MENSKGLSYHILPVAATMTGVCVTVITLFRVTNMSKSTVLDEALALVAFLFIMSCFYSYLSLRKENARRERIADMLFFIALFCMVIISALMAFY